VTSSKSYSADNASFTFNTGFGNKTVYVWFKDTSNNISDRASASIRYNSFKVPDTVFASGYEGVTETFGEDYDYLANPPSLIDNGDGTVTDQNTNLVWQQQDDGTVRDWSSSVTYCSDLSLGGQTDWRLPTAFELQTIVDYGKENPAIDTTYFPNHVSNQPHTPADHFWSATEQINSPTVAWMVRFQSGHVGHRGKADYSYVRCVHFFGG
jgi:hypothetical protein